MLSIKTVLLLAFHLFLLGRRGHRGLPAVANARHLTAHYIAITKIDINPSRIFIQLGAHMRGESDLDRRPVGPMRTAYFPVRRMRQSMKFAITLVVSHRCTTGTLGEITC